MEITTLESNALPFHFAWKVTLRPYNSVQVYNSVNCQKHLTLMSRNCKTKKVAENKLVLMLHLRVHLRSHFKEPLKMHKKVKKRTLLTLHLMVQLKLHLSVQLRTLLRVHLKAHLKVYFKIYKKMHRKVGLRLKLRMHLSNDWVALEDEHSCALVRAEECTKGFNKKLNLKGHSMLHLIAHQRFYFRKHLKLHQNVIKKTHFTLELIIHLTVQSRGAFDGAPKGAFSNPHNNVKGA